jgi:hypothetical protein
MGRSTLVIPDQDSDLVLGSGKHAVAPYREQLRGCQLMRTRLRLPGLTTSTADLAFGMEAEDPWAWQSGISTATDAMVTWILLKEMKKLPVTYEPRSGVLRAAEQETPLHAFIPEGLSEHCYPTEAYFAQDVCTYLSQWWTVQQEVDGDLDGAEVRIDAILTHREDPDIVIGVEFKNPQGHINALKGLTQAAKYRKAHWEGHGRLPIAYCCPGRVPSGREARYVLKSLKVGLLDFCDAWSLTTPDFSWNERVGLLTKEHAS